MITLIEALNYRCLRYISTPLEPFHVMVGPNASGKTTFLDVVGLLQDIVCKGLDEALSIRTQNPEELLFQRQGEVMELAIEARIPEKLRELTAKPELDTIRYEVSIGYDAAKRWFEFKAETLLFKLGNTTKVERVYMDLFPAHINAPESIRGKRRQGSTKLIINKVPGGNDNFYSETYGKDGKSGKGWAPSFKLGSQKVAFRNLPEDQRAFPVAMWFREHLRTGVQSIMLNSLAMRHPSPPSRARAFLPDGSNLPWVVERLRKGDKTGYRHWMDHLQTALTDLREIQTIERSEDKHCYLVYTYRDGTRVPSWLVSDGTLRLTALTIPAYLGDLQGMYLVEEPENGIHPRAVENAYKSLSSVYGAQVLLATHSPVILNAASPEHVLCFAKNEQGATDIVPGSGHPKLRQWNREVSLGTLFAAGVLG